MAAGDADEPSSRNAPVDNAAVDFLENKRRHLEQFERQSVGGEEKGNIEISRGSTSDFRGTSTFTAAQYCCAIE